MELSIYDIIKRPLITTKSIDLHKKLGQYTFEVHKNANKVMVRSAIEKLWNVEIDKVRIINIVGKLKRFNRREFVTSGQKKAIVTLKRGYKIEIPGMFETTAVEQSMKTKSEGEGD